MEKKVLVVLKVRSNRPIDSSDIKRDIIKQLHYSELEYEFVSLGERFNTEGPDGKDSGTGIH